MIRDRQKKFKFTDEIVASDTVISLMFGVLGLIAIIFSICYSVALKGDTPEWIGMLLLISAIMDLTALVFALTGLRSQDGGAISKRIALIVSIIDAVALVGLYVLK